VGAAVHADAVPLSTPLSYYCQMMRLDPLRFALDGGEDYELLFTVPMRRLREVLIRLPRETGVGVSPVGRIVPKARGIRLIGPQGRSMTLRPRGFDHFRIG
jgi:thiamine-monophosphate kinase